MTTPVEMPQGSGGSYGGLEGAMEALLRDKLVEVTSRSTLPAADVTFAGRLIRIPGAAAARDAVYVCIKTAADSYAWTSFDAGVLADLSAIDFLVGTATPLLSAEIAVGTTPGGELAGGGTTWASPKVSTSHSGNAHMALAGELTGSRATPTITASHSGSVHTALQESWLPLIYPGAASITLAALTANSAYLFAMTPVTVGMTITNFICRIGTASGNIDAGIYSFDGTTFTRVVSLGSTVCPTAATRVVLDIADSAVSSGTRYFFAWAPDNGTVTIQSIQQNSSVAWNKSAYRFTSSFPLPASIAASGDAGYSGQVPIIMGTVSGGLAI